jgi:hypothetical protein
LQLHHIAASVTAESNRDLVTTLSARLFPVLERHVAADAGSLVTRDLFDETRVSAEKFSDVF